MGQIRYLFWAAPPALTSLQNKTLMEWLRWANIVVTQEGTEPFDLLCRDLDGVVQHGPNDPLVTGRGRIRPKIAVIATSLRQKIRRVDHVFVIVDHFPDLGRGMV